MELPPVEPGPRLPFRSIPGIAGASIFGGPATVLEVIAGNPMISLDDDGDGEPDGSNAIVLAAAWLPPSFSLLVAEGVTDPDGDPVRIRWRQPSRGTLYATVAYPDSGIVPGTALSSGVLLEAYAANSILYEAPEDGFPIQDAQLDGGRVAISAQAIDVPADGPPSRSSWQTRTLGYADPMEVRITIAEQEDADGICDVTFRAELDASFGNPITGLPPERYTTFRWEVGDEPMVDVPAWTDLEVELEPGLHTITLVAASWGPYSGAVPGLTANPFVHPPDAAPFVRETFSSYGSTLSDTETIDCDPPDDRRRSLLVEKLPDRDVVVAPPGEEVQYAVLVTNDGDVPVTVDSLEDIVDGVRTGITDCFDPLPVLLDVGDELICFHEVLVDWPPGFDHENTVVAYGHDEQGSLVIGRGHASVEVDYPDGDLIVSKRPSVTELDIPGGTVTFEVEIYNPTEGDVTVESVLDDRYVGVGAWCDPSLPTVLKPRQIMRCDFEVDLMSGPTLHENTLTVRGTDANGRPVEAKAKATVLIDDFLSTIRVEKTLIGPGPVLDETKWGSGGTTLRYDVRFHNDSKWDSITLTSILDEETISHPDREPTTFLHDIRAACEDQIARPITIPPGGSASCEFALPAAGRPGDEHVDRVLVEFVDSDGDTDAEASNTVTVVFEDVPSSLEVTKVPSPDTVPPEGGDVTYRVTIRNTSRTDAVTILTITDDQQLPLGDCTDLILLTLAPDQEVTCWFAVHIDPAQLPDPETGSRTLEHVNTVTVRGRDDDDRSVPPGRGTATVIVEGRSSCIHVTKRPAPSSVREPGGFVTFWVTVENCSTRDFTINDISDDKFPDEADGCFPPLRGTTLPPGGSAECYFIARVDGQPADPPHVDTVTVTADYGGLLRSEEVSGSGRAEVRIEDVPSSISVTKKAKLAGTSPGSAWFDYSVVIVNTSKVDDVFIHHVVDPDLPLLEEGCSPRLETPIPPGGRVECTALVNIPGNPGDQHTNTVRVFGMDDDGVVWVPVTASTTITLPEGASLVVTKTADPDVIAEPGSDAVEFMVSVRNASILADITITEISDSRYASITRAGECGVLLGATLTPGETRTCTYVRPVLGQPGEYPNIVAVKGRDQDGRDVEAPPARAVVEIRDVPSSIEVTKEADPEEAASGDVVDYTVTVRNVLPDVDQTIASVVDVPFGDISASCDPVPPAVLAPGETMTCRYGGTVTGEPGDEFPNIVTATTAGTFYGSAPVSDSAGATVTIVERSELPSPISVTKTGKPVSWGTDGGILEHEVVIENVSDGRDVTIDDVEDITAAGTIESSTCSPVVGSALAPGERMVCTNRVQVPFPPEEHSDVVYVYGTDAEGRTAFGWAEATVRIPATARLDITKFAGTLSSLGGPISVVPGATVTYTVGVANPSNLHPVTITSISDDRFADIRSSGDCALLIGVTLAPGDIELCDYSVAIIGPPGEFENRVTVRGEDEYGNRIGPWSATAVVDILPDDLLDVTKEVDPAEVVSGDTVTYTITLKSKAVLSDIVIASIDDPDSPNVEADCATVFPTTLGPLTSLICTYDAIVIGEPGDVITDTVTVTHDAATGGTFRRLVSASASVTIVEDTDIFGSADVDPAASGWAIIGLEELREISAVCVATTDQEVKVTTYHTIAYSAWETAAEAQASIDRERAKERSPTWQIFPDCGAARTPRFRIDFVQTGLTEEEAKAFIAAFDDDERRYAPFSGPTWVTLTGEESGTRTEVAAVIYEEAAGG